jgi:hypothetical protein
MNKYCLLGCLQLELLYSAFLFPKFKLLSAKSLYHLLLSNPLSH